MKQTPLPVVLLAAAIGLGLTPNYTVWKLNDGKAIEGVQVDIDTKGQTIRLRDREEQILTVPFSKLSDADVAKVKQWGLLGLAQADFEAGMGERSNGMVNDYGRKDYDFHRYGKPLTMKGVSVYATFNDEGNCIEVQFFYSYISSTPVDRSTVSLDTVRRWIEMADADGGWKPDGKDRWISINGAVAEFRDKGYEKTSKGQERIATVTIRNKVQQEAFERKWGGPNRPPSDN